jgi:3-phosphoshikimate 1-carboxyvinyltransferase
MKGWAKDDGLCLKCPENIGRTMSLTIVIPVICVIIIVFLIKTANPSNNKKIQIPGDKSCSIRAILLGSQCIGVSKIKNLLESEDVLNCVNTLKKTLGVKITKKNGIYSVYGNGLNSFKLSKKITKIYVGNSGTFARLLCGLLATTPGKFYLYGDKSMNKRDFSRVVLPPMSYVHEIDKIENRWPAAEKFIIGNS